MSDFDPSRVDELTAEQAQEFHRVLAHYGYCTPSLPDAPRAGGETPTDAAMLDLLADAAKRLREHAMRSPLDCGCNDVAERLLEFSAALPSLLARQRDGERDTARLTWVLGNTYQGIMLEPSAVRPELVEDRDYYGPWYVHSREDIDNAMPVSAPSAERA